jgi:hypothetical protein
MAEVRGRAESRADNNMRTRITGATYSTCGRHRNEMAAGERQCDVRRSAKNRTPMRKYNFSLEDRRPISRPRKDERFTG